MTRISFQQAEQLWTQAGGRADLAPTMAAIAMAESGLNTQSMNRTPPDYSVGLWQINYYGSMYSGRSAQFGTPEQLLADPAAQARAAVKIYQEQGLRAWSTYTSGAYRQYMNGAPAPLGSDSPPGTGTTGGGMDGTTVTQADMLDADCLWGFTMPVTGNTICLLTKGHARAIMGATLLAAGSVVASVGLIVLAAYGLKKSGALETAAQAAAFVPGGGGAASKLAASAAYVRQPAQGAQKRTAAKAAQKQAAAKKQAPAKKTTGGP